ncbi:calcium-dependent phosphotriesterase [Aspergillus heteromorphus CBS 117.55]|uniref:Calcium-dependent phosphotriesterase n=1 Tax=Aspergillus heteromorphus CBS 117.55 TaxID=1448321 RepID=A0A317VPR8_9EURO|nr:calcium-dependent phosphotriesterase [Aspergillus heteromorphus CBS 117.55]PWY75047.1 calcium-dependent phosphotriesterase [Aspergillus heteromorphus CBS 117.55]
MANLILPSWANASQIPPAFEFYDSRFLNITGPAPKLEVLLENEDFAFAHEASVFIPSTNELFVTSNILTDPVTNQSTVKISRVNTTANPVTSEVINSTIPLANGGVNHGSGILFCGQGTLNQTGGLFQMSIDPPYASENLVANNFYGRDFNSLNDVVVHTDGSIWFTDPSYGYLQGIRPEPELPNQVYRFDPATGNVRVVADGFSRPNGLAFTADEKTIYITDTGRTVGDGSTDPLKPATIYAFDVTVSNGEPFLTNRRVFAMADTGIPDGIKTDTEGNVYAGCGDGVNVWSSGGVLLGKILIEDGTSNFSFGRNGQMFIMNENKLWSAQLGRWVRGSLLKI